MATVGLELDLQSKNMCKSVSHDHQGNNPVSRLRNLSYKTSNKHLKKIFHLKIFLFEHLKGCFTIGNMGFQ